MYCLQEWQAIVVISTPGLLEATSIAQRDLVASDVRERLGSSSLSRRQKDAGDVAGGLGAFMSSSSSVLALAPRIPAICTVRTSSRPQELGRASLPSGR